MIRVRAFAAGDHASVMELWCRAWEATVTGIDFRARWPVMLAQWDEIIAEGGQARVAELDGAVRGFSVLDRGGSHLEQIAVDPDYFGSGVARILLDTAKRQAHNGLTLVVNTFNDRALRFYEREGFRRISEGINEVSGLPVWTCEWRPATP